ncbi:MAG: hypothetical protein HYX45_03330 [Burkholderiales bacterium]|nr:hypothetical protein [Burkholderiales bacterium]
MIVAGLMAASGALGAYAYATRLKKQEQAKRRIPRKWPLVVRAMVNSRERLVWRWMLRAFQDHHVMIKLPVTRFTMPQVREEGQHWFQILGGVYCTFTVCNSDGQVVGCVDVPGPQGLSLSNQTLKHTLLSQCNVRYWVVDPEHLPSVSTIRAAFLGEQAVMKEELERVRTETEFNQTRANLKAALIRQRNNQPTASDFARLEALMSTDPHSHDAYESQLSTTWKHDSFVAPLDSRTGELTEGR